MQHKRRFNWLGWIILLALIAGAGYGAWWYWNKPKDDAQQTRTAVVTRGDVTQAVTATGQINPVANVQVGSQISGMIQQLYADFNSSVTQGQVIAQLDPSTYRASLLQAEAELASAQASLELAQIDARRAGELSRGKLIPEAEHDKAQADMRGAEAQKRLREAMVEKARVDLARCTIMSPTNGMVISRNVDVGQTVAASLQAPTLYVIANDLTKMQIDAMVSEADIGGIETNQTVSFTVDAFPTRTFAGKVIQIRNAPTTNQNVVTYDCVVSVDNHDMKLKPGMTANVSIILAEHADVLKVPNAAFRFRPADTNKVVQAPQTAAAGGTNAGGSGPERRGGWSAGGGGAGRGAGGGGMRGQRGGAGRERGASIPIRTVYVIGSTNADAKLEMRHVKIGISDGAQTEILEGLKENELVVTGQDGADTSRAPGAPGGAPSNPFGGGGRRF
ncbi:MAG TPA: efflux RND transporter periplasmic adaptor subunit [Candidatus Acidoferrum sp.]|nr:efflux RND transporter periplasmic adaptor subunit [Candidatus Acidoferrum sp.]